MDYMGFSGPARVRLIFSQRVISKTPAIMLAFFVLLGILIPPNTTYAFGEGGPTVPNANVFGFESSDLRVDGPTGALTERIPILIPPGRNGLQPDIGLEYNSQRTEDGIVGYGWGLSIPYIQRFNKTGSQDLYSSSATFSSSIDGELVQVSTTTAVTHRARVDTGASNTYSFADNTWTVYDKKGTRYLFGANDTGRQYDTATTSTRTYTWMLQEIRDTNDNYVTFSYTRDDNQLYPSQVTYTGSGATPGVFAVTFTTETRPDVRESYKAGFKITTNKRISAIDAFVASSTVGTYLLSYGTGNNSTRSLLTSVQQKGYDEDSTLVTLPAMTFTYASSTSMFYTPSSGGDIFLAGPAYIPGDTNGNGKNDVNYFYNNNNGQGTKSQMYIDQSTNVTNVVPPDYWGYYGSAQERGVRYVDVNGDGKPDVVTGYQNDQTGTTTSSLSVNNYATSTATYGWTASTTYNGTIPDFGYQSYNGLYVMTSGIFGEINGDGLPDYVMALPGYTGTETYLGNGSAWTATTTIFAPVYNMPTTVPTETASQLVDINGDGLDDWVYSSGSNTYTRLNNGTGWNGSASSQWTIATSTLYQTSVGGSTVYNDRGIRFMDMNGDALPDFVRSYYMPTHTACTGVAQGEVATVKQVFLNTGNGWATSTAYTLPEYITYGNVDSSSPCNFTGVYTHKEYVNWTGNGQMKQDVVTNLTSSKGAQKTISYTPSAQLGTNIELPVSLLVVTTTAESDGFGNVATSSYEYSGGKVYLANGIRDRKFGGFAVSTTTTPDSVAVTYYSQGTGLNTTLGEQTNGYAQINRPFRKDIFDLSSVLKKRTYSRWDSSDISGSTFLGLGRELSLDYASDGSTHRDKGTDFLYASTTNDLLRMTEYGEVTGSSDGTFSDTGTDKRTTLFTYVASTSVNMSLPRSKTLFDYSNATTTDDRYYYDTLSFGSVTKGNRTTSEKLKSGATYISTQNAYNSYGLPTSSTDPRGKVTTYTYDSKNLYIATSTNPLSQTTQFYYDYSLGKPKQTIDSNSRVFETVFDGLDRPLTEKQPDISSPNSLVTKKTYAYTDTIGSRKILETNHLDGSTDFTLYTYLDGLDRPLQKRKEAEEADQFSVRDFVYNNTGVLQKESLPYFSTGTSKASATSTDVLYSRYTYDALKRPLTIANAVGTTTNLYGAWIATSTDALGNSRGLAYDAFGRLVQVTLPDTGNVTAYTYDTVGNLSSITDANANVRNFTYNALSQRLTAEDLHAGGDGTYGTWSYVYDASGNLASTTDPKGQQIDYVYDDINRALTEDYLGQGGTEVSYAYDSCGEGIGRLCIATSTGAVSSYVYNALGLVASESKKISSTIYSTASSYDRQGNLTGIVYPDNSEASYAYNNAGLLETVSQKESGDSFAPLISDLDYGPTEKVTYKLFGNGVDSAYTYDANALYRLTNILTLASPSDDEEGGDLGFMGGGEDLWSNIARATEQLPLAIQGILGVWEEATTSETSTSFEEVFVTDTPQSDTTSEASNFSEEVSTTATTSVTELTEQLNIVADTPESTSPDSLPIVENEMVETKPIDSTPISFEPISALLAGRNSDERASIKGQEIANIGSVSRTSRKNYDIEVMSMEPIEGGVQVFARAWKDGVQIGFGTDGRVDMERFRIFNPPILVPDEKGNIVRESEVENEAGEKEKIQQRFREDPQEALIQVIEHNLSVMHNIHGDQNIVKGKIGRTTSTFFPAAGANTPVDGFARRSPGETGWSDVRNGAGTLSDSTGGIANPISGYGTTVGGTPTSMVRSIFGFNTASIPDTDVVSSAVLSVWAYNAAGSGVTLVVDRNVPSNTASIANSDYDIGGWGGSDLSDRVSWGSSQYINYTLNSTGRGFINQTGNSWFGLRHIKDMDDSYTSGSTSFANGSYVDATGTSEDPSLVVEHAQPNNVPTAPTNLLSEGQTNPVDITDSTPEFSAIYTDPDTSDVAMHYQIQVATSSTFASVFWNSTKTALASSTPQGTRIADISYSGSALASTTTYYWRIKFWDASDEGDWSTATSTFSLLNPNLPTAPTSLQAEGQTNPSGITDSTPEFSAIYNDPNAGDVALAYQIQVATSSAFSAGFLWDSTKTTLASSTPQGTRIADISYAGSALASTTTYYWRIKFWDTADNVGAWSTATSTFSLRALHFGTTTPIQNISFTYDAVGNITNVSDYSDTGLGKVVTYTYDFLYRLTLASTTAATSTPFSRSYTYDKLGNITYASSLGSYTYESGTARYSNPHAPVSVASVSYLYDTNGNLTNYASTTNAWDYRNRLTATYASSSPATFYQYDNSAQRVQKGSGIATTTYPNKYYNLNTATTTKHIFAGDQLIATITTAGVTNAKQYIHTDWLGGTNVVTDVQGNTVEVEDPYPYGASRISETYGVQKDQRQYAGTERDFETNLDYMINRYYEANRGQFLSQDPVFWGRQNLANPQSQNSYSYAENDPINKKDPEGLQAMPGSAGRYYEQRAEMINALNTFSFTYVSGFAVLGLSGVAIAAPALSPELGLVVQGALVNTALRATSDARSGAVSTPGQYVGTAVFGGGTGLLTAGRGLIGTVGITGISTVVENKLLGGSITSGQVFSTSLGAGAGKVAGGIVSNVPALKPFSSVLAPAVNSFATYGVTAVTTPAVNIKSDKKK